jgi:hypothetical protein
MQHKIEFYIKNTAIVLAIDEDGDMFARLSGVANESRALEPWEVEYLIKFFQMALSRQKDEPK